MLLMHLKRSERLCGVYSLTHKASGLVYVGRSVDIRRRLDAHRAARNDMLVSRQIRESGFDSFDVQILELCDCSSLDEREAHWVKALGSLHPNGLNLRSGGRRSEFCCDLAISHMADAQRGKSFSEVHRANLSRSHIGHKNSPAARAKMSASHRGKKRSESARQSMSDAQARRWAKWRDSKAIEGNQHAAS